MVPIRHEHISPYEIIICKFQLRLHKALEPLVPKLEKSFEMLGGHLTELKMDHREGKLESERLQEFLVSKQLYKFVLSPQTPSRIKIWDWSVYLGSNVCLWCGNPCGSPLRPMDGGPWWWWWWRLASGALEIQSGGSFIGSDNII